MHVSVIAGVICAGGVALESLCAGKSIRKRLTELRWPRYSPSLRAWVLIGGAYYVICFVVWIRLLQLPDSAWRTAAFALAASVMAVNAIWNLFFFRSRNLSHALICGIVYTTFAITLLLILTRIDRTAALWFLPYAVYLAYANLWGWRVWKLNTSHSH